MSGQNRATVLTRLECDALLATGRIGRVVMTRDALPVALPVNYAMDGGDVVFRTAGGSKLSTAVSRHVVAFEVDEFDYGGRTGWSVLVTGVAEALTDMSDIVRADQLSIDTWLPTEGMSYVRITPGMVSGRRIGG